MNKIVSKGKIDCTITLDGTECEVKFDRCYRAFAIENNSSGDVYISVEQGAAAGDDGVRRIKLGCSAVYAMRIDENTDTVYVTGAGDVQIHAQNDVNNPFRNAPVSSGGGEYIFPSGTEYSAIIELVAGDTVIDKTIGYGFMAKISDVDDRRKLSMCVVDTNGSTVATLTGGTSYPLSSEAYVSRIEVMQKTGNWWYAEVTVKYYSNGELKTTTLTTGTTNKLANFGASGHQISVRNN